MNRENLKQKIKKSLKWIYQNDATQGDRLLLHATDNLIAYEPFFINRHSANLDEFINSATDYLFRIDKDNSVLIRVAEFPINVSGFQTFPSDYAQIINARSSDATAKVSGGGSTSGSSGGGGSGIINIGSLEGLGSLLFTPKETLTTTTTTTTPSKEVVKESGTTTIVIVIVAVLLIALLIYFLTKK